MDDELMGPMERQFFRIFAGVSLAFAAALFVMALTQ